MAVTKNNNVKKKVVIHDKYERLGRKLFGANNFDRDKIRAKYRNRNRRTMAKYKRGRKQKEVYVRRPTLLKLRILKKIRKLGKYAKYKGKRVVSKYLKKKKLMLRRARRQSRLTRRLAVSENLKNKLTLYYFVTNFFCSFIRNGNKLCALKMLHRLFFNIKIRIMKYLPYKLWISVASKRLTTRDPLWLFEKLFLIARPLIGARLLKLGGMVYKVPAYINLDKRVKISLSFIRKNVKNVKAVLSLQRAANKRNFISGLTMYSTNIFDDFLLNLLYKTVLGKGAILKMRDEFHMLVSDNRSFLRFFR